MKELFCFEALEIEAASPLVAAGAMARSLSDMMEGDGSRQDEIYATVGFNVARLLVLAKKKLSVVSIFRPPRFLQPQTTRLACLLRWHGSARAIQPVLLGDPPNSHAILVALSALAFS